VSVYNQPLKTEKKIYPLKNILVNDNQNEAGVQITTHQLAKREKNPCLASKCKPTRQSDKGFFPLTDPFCILSQLFPDLASENTELLASLVSVLKKLFTPIKEVKLAKILCVSMLQYNVMHVYSKCLQAVYDK
jgi:hypothetical protein